MLPDITAQQGGARRRRLSALFVLMMSSSDRLANSVPVIVLFNVAWISGVMIAVMIRQEYLRYMQLQRVPWTG